MTAVVVIAAIAPSMSGVAATSGIRSAESQTSIDDWSMFHHDPAHLGVSTDPAVGATAAASALRLAWKTPVGSKVSASPAVVYNGTLGKTLVYVQTQNNVLIALDANSGSVVWSYTEPGSLGADASPAVYANTVYVAGVHNDTLFAVNATSGALECSFATTGRIFSSPVVADLGNGPEVFIGEVGLSETANAGHMWAITGVGNPAGGCKLVWSFNGFFVTNNGTQTGVWSPPALGFDSNNRPILVFGTSQPDSSVYALDARTGALIWHYRTATKGDLDVGAGAAITASGVNGFADGEVYIDGKNQVLYAFDLMTGSVRWHFKMSKPIHVVVNSVSTPAVVGGTVYVAYGYGVWAFDAVTGKKRWYSGTASPTGGYILSSPAVAGAAGDQAIYSNDTSGAITAYRLSDGVALWRYATASGLGGSDAIADEQVFLGGADSNVYAFAA